MSLFIDLDVKGLDELIKDTSPELLDEPLQDFFGESARIVRRSVWEKTPKFSGKLARSIKSYVDRARPPLWAKVSSSWYIAVFVEYGTKKHFPPWAKVAGLASRMGLQTPGILARSIGKTGTRGRYMFGRAATETQETVDRLLTEAADKIVKDWEGK